MNVLRVLLLSVVLLFPLTKLGHASEPTLSTDSSTNSGNDHRLQQLAEKAQSAMASTSAGIGATLETGLGFLGIRYRRGGNGPESGGFDCSGLVKRVFGVSLGLNLPRTSAEIAKVGDKIDKNELVAGDLVFFNTMNRAFSHVGIYLGDNRFLHSPAAGGVVRVENMDITYWRKRFNGGRRVIDAAAR
jgi:cell wall-associated NlpC family hydrolase